MILAIPGRRRSGGFDPCDVCELRALADGPRRWPAPGRYGRGRPAAGLTAVIAASPGPDGIVSRAASLPFVGLQMLLPLTVLTQEQRIFRSVV